MTTYSVVGRPVTREDGPEKVSGEHLYSADIILPGMIWGKVLRCPYAHAKILSIDTTEAARLPGVRAVLTGKDLAGMRVGRYMRDVPPLAEEKVRFVGERVAAVAADDPDIAEEALNLIEVEYEALLGNDYLLCGGKTGNPRGRARKGFRRASLFRRHNPARHDLGQGT